jgi:hypothetical protein
MARGTAFVEGVNFALEVCSFVSAWYDENKIEDHTGIALKVVQDFNIALTKGMIPEKYQTQDGIVNIMNVILLGVNNTNDPEIYKIGMNIYNTISNPPAAPTTPTVNPPGSATPTDATKTTP